MKINIMYNKFDIRQTDQVRTLSGWPISSPIPDGLCILAPQILVSTVSYASTFSIAAGFTKPAH